MKTKIPTSVVIDGYDTGFTSDDGPFRSYVLCADGKTMDGLMESAVIFEVDQDGGEYRDAPLGDYSSKLIAECEELFKHELITLQEMRLAYGDYQAEKSFREMKNVGDET